MGKGSKQFNPQNRRKFSIPNVCQHFGVAWRAQVSFPFASAISARAAYWAPMVNAH